MHIFIGVCLCNVMVAVQYMIRSKNKKKIETDEKKIFIAARKMWVLLESVFLMILYSNEECALVILNSGLYMRQSYMTNCIKIVIPWPGGYKTSFMLSSAETKIYPAHKC